MRLLIRHCYWFVLPWFVQAAAIEGFLEPGRHLQLSTPDAGIIEEVNVQEGHSVRAGQMLLQLDASVLEKDLKIVAEEYALLEKRVKKLRQLRSDQYASEDELFRAEGELRIVGLKRERIEAQLERKRLRAPIDGVVTELRYDLGEGVGGPGTHVATLVSLDPLQIQFAIPLQAASAMSVGEQIQLAVSGQDTLLAAEVVFISPVSTAVVNTVRVKLLVPNPNQRIPAGLRCLLTID
ncbi:efflux RND transporter periplasmic adaptor subunit [Coraliomargarita akajimensis]|uniref:Secretion protein HlyD family protein n=1 Tax=Coraliomargarita akajimensis (strain DSM 45221 / IAM 15411 / JCM 23193 / KCTC 12865 / 04OKA010-24) TaxID=583355 RepID=D5EP89_CORAD|nr:efflux RND transporter periplasmic adaptor subunit [Coraliomargarita akajimensis]ADE55599.1 secretion protein HlyD family protein [Coraliomargarita akajimensis DSM 45221]